MSALIGVIVLGAVSMGGSSLYRHYQANQLATNRAAQIGTALSAADKYARKNETAILNGQPIAGIANALSPTIAELKIAGFLPQGFEDSSKVGGPIRVTIMIEPTGCAGAKCQMAVRAFPTASITDTTGQPDQALAAKIAAALPNGSGWSNLASDMTKLAKNSFTMPNPLGASPAVVVAQEWIGTNQASTTVPPIAYESNVVADCAYGGSTTYQRTLTTDKWGAVTAGAWVYLTDSCQAPPTPPGDPVAPPAPAGPTPVPPAEPTPIDPAAPPTAPTVVPTDPAVTPTDSNPINVAEKPTRDCPATYVTRHAGTFCWREDKEPDSYEVPISQSCTYSTGWVKNDLFQGDWINGCKWY